VEAVVVGGGPAGSITALCLARAGAAVTVVERARFPRRKVCGEYLSAGTVRLLDGLGLGAAVRQAAARLTGIRLIAPGAPPVVLHFAEPALALARERLDTILLAAACDAGARLVRARAEDVVSHGGRAIGVAVRDEAGDQATLNARFVVGADGSGSLIARRVGVVRPSRGARKFAVGGHYRGFGAMDGLVEMYVGAGAYFAINPLSESLANVMVVVNESALAEWSRDVDVGVRGKAAELGRGQRSFAGTERVGPRVAIGPLAFDVRKTTAPGALLVGDAAGFLNPFTGQGVYLAVTGAVAAARTILEALRYPARETQATEAYDFELRREFDARRRLSRLVTTLIDVPLLARRAASTLARKPGRGDDLVAALSGLASPSQALAPAALARLLW
jgi:menaquinone-9 beta-reductase